MLFVLLFFLGIASLLYNNFSFAGIIILPSFATSIPGVTIGIRAY